MYTADVTRDYWPDAVSDGLSLPCSDCGAGHRISYRVSDDEWANVVPDDPVRLGHVCLDCFMVRGGDPTMIEEIQVVGLNDDIDGVTALFHPGRAYRWQPGK